MIVPFGKYEGLSVEELVESDILYCQWLLKNAKPKSIEQHKDFFQQLSKAVDESSSYDDSDLIMRFGKYEGLRIDEFIDDKSYCKWLIDQESVRNEYASIHKELSKLYAHYYLKNPDHSAGYLYALVFKNAEYIKIGFTNEFIVKRIYNYGYGFSIYKNDNIDFEKSIVIKTNDIEIESRIKTKFPELRLDKKNEKYKKEALASVIKFIKLESLERIDLFYYKKCLKEFLPFIDGFDFKRKFKLKNNQFDDFIFLYETYLMKNGLSTEYNPSFQGFSN